MLLHFYAKRLCYLYFYGILGIIITMYKDLACIKAHKNCLYSCGYKYNASFNIKSVLNSSKKHQNIVFWIMNNKHFSPIKGEKLLSPPLPVKMEMFFKIYFNFHLIISLFIFWPFFNSIIYNINYFLLKILQFTFPFLQSFVSI